MVEKVDPWSKVGVYVGKKPIFSLFKLRYLVNSFLATYIEIMANIFILFLETGNNFKVYKLSCLLLYFCSVLLLQSLEFSLALTKGNHSFLETAAFYHTLRLFVLFKRCSSDFFLSCLYFSP